MFYLLLALIFGVSAYCFNNRSWLSRLSFSPFEVHQSGQWYRFVTHVFVHSNWPHLLINLFVFYSFGNYVVSAYQGIKGNILGGLLFAVMMIGAAVFSSIKSFAKHKDNPTYHAVGASGVVSAVLFAFVLMQPLNGVYLFFIPIPIPAFLFGGAYLFYEYYMDKKMDDKVAHDAHFFGALFGILFTCFLDFNIPVNFISSVFSYFT